MFCYQCEQTAKGEGCQTMGVCGKDEATATLQDLLLEAVKGIAIYAHRAHELGVSDDGIDGFVLEALFATLTNVNFDAESVAGLIRQAAVVRDQARKLYERAAAEAGREPEHLTGAAAFVPAETMDGLLGQGAQHLLPMRFLSEGKEIANLRELVLYGIKGVAAYAYHARVLGEGAAEDSAEIHRLLALLSQPVLTADQLLTAAMEVGAVNFRVMETLDRANTTAYGTPIPTAVELGARKGKAILVSGHDLRDLEELLKQTEGLGINIYTHGEMLPAHGYPKLKAYKHLAGNYGGAWMDQGVEFAAFPGAILMTSNCIQNPKGYTERIFTAGPVEWPGVKHIEGHDFAPLIAAALEAPGFGEDVADKQITVGFGHGAVLGVAGAVVDAVKAGAIRRFFVIGGCDGARTGRNYYTELAEKLPADTMILTLGCGKYRFNKMEFGTIGGLPRLLDLGQCNDTYSALKIALALAEVFECGVNDLPLSLVLSWYEQKAVAVLLTLLHLGVRNIRIGPTLPAFLSPDAIGLLHEKFGLMATDTADADMAAMLA